MEPRWRTPGDFLADLPRFHCSVKPAHSFCTVCQRINPSVGADCPMRFEQGGGPPLRAAPPQARGDFYPVAPPRSPEARVEAMAHEHVSAASVLPDAPVIEFAQRTEPHKPRKRMKARAVQKRTAADRPDDGPEPTKRRDPDDRVWATHEAGGPAPPPPVDEDADQRELSAWDPEAQVAPQGPDVSGRRRPPRPPK